MSTELKDLVVIISKQKHPEIILDYTDSLQTIPVKEVDYYDQENLLVVIINRAGYLVGDRIRRKTLCPGVEAVFNLAGQMLCLEFANANRMLPVEAIAFGGIYDFN